MNHTIDKKLFLICAFSLCAFILSSCGQAGAPGTESERIEAPVDIRYIIQNPLTFSDINENEQFGGMEFSGSYFQISGLKDQQVEDTINEHLQSMYALCQPGEVPQEAYKKFGGLECTNQEIKLTCYGNFNNVLSVGANYTWAFGDLSGDRAPTWDCYYGEVETYNVDLNTGQEISLKDVFADNVDYSAMIAAEAEDILNRQGTEVNGDALAESLSAYLAEPRFLLWDSAFQTVGFSYTDPSSDDGQDAEVSVGLSFNENFAVAKRFYDPDENIYSGDNEGEKTLLTYVGEIKEWKKNYTDEGVNVSLHAKYQEEFPEYALQAVFAEESADGDLIDRMKQVLNGLSAQETDAYYDRFVDTSRVQDFINIRVYESAQVYSLTTDVSHLYSARQMLRCYRLGSGEPVQIRDIFREGADVEGILETAVANKLEADQQLLEESGQRRTIDVAAHAGGAADKFIGFCVNNDAIFAEYLGNPAMPSYVIELKYADMGYGNLNIFD